MAFLRNLLATLLGLIIFCFLIIMLISGIAASGDAIPEVKSNSVLSINLSGVLVERAIEDPLAELMGNGPSQLGLTDVLSSIKAAKTDDRIKGIYLKPMYLQAGQASLLEIRNALRDFKESGKFVYAYGEFVSESDYLVASIADSLFINPEGQLEFNGLSVTMTFYKGLFDKLDIEPEIFRVGTYKSYVEPFIRKSMSDENRLQMEELLQSMQETYLNTVAENVNLEYAALKEISDKMLVRRPDDAEKLGLISAVAYEDEMLTLLRKELGIGAMSDINFISPKSYSKTLNSGYSSNKIAVIVANGDITMGSGSEDVAGKTFAEEIRKARENESVKGIVLRVNSPGGSLTGSDLIWREVMLTKGVKPIIASMANVAASGGYYISAPCDTIVAQPNTITGSIGIFSILFNFGDFLDNKLGITTDNVKTGEFSDYFTVTRSLTPSERAIFQTQIEKGYDTFLSKVSGGRNMTREEVEKLAGGRVWTGAQAYEVGLVDILGSYDDAIQIAATKAGVGGDFMIRYYPEQKELIDEILEKMSGEGASVFAPRETLITPYIEKIESLKRMNGIQAKLPGDLQIN